MALVDFIVSFHLVANYQDQIIVNPSVQVSDYSHNHKGNSFTKPCREVLWPALTSGGGLHVCTKEDLPVKPVLKLVCGRGL